MNQSNLLTVVFSYTDLSILHINEAAAGYFGRSAEEIKSLGASAIVECFEDEQLKFAAKAAEINSMELSKGPKNDVLNSFICYANWIINSKLGKRYRSLFRIFPIELNDNGLPKTGMYLVYDVMPFLHAGSWWYRSSSGNKNFIHYHSSEMKFQQKDLLSSREKDILSYLAEGFSSKEIAEHLHVSSHTIDNHRRRMLAKTGSVDTSALIYIAKLSGML
jgi:DNA-binding CsgD family transcriptional regulator